MDEVVRCCYKRIVITFLFNFQFFFRNNRSLIIKISEHTVMEIGKSIAEKNANRLLANLEYLTPLFEVIYGISNLYILAWRSKVVPMTANAF